MNRITNSNKHLNIKKVIIVLIIFIVLILLSVFSYLKFKKNKISNNNQNKDENQILIENSNQNSTFYDINKTISLDLSNKYNLISYQPIQDYLIELRSDNNLDIFISEQGDIDNKSLDKIVKADKLAYIQKFNSYSNLSEIKELTVNGNLAYTYSFHYLDTNLNQPFYIQIVWLKIGEKYYIFDIEFPLTDLPNYTTLITDILANFKIISE